MKRHGIDWSGKNVVVLGRGITVGRPLGLLLTRREVNATATLAHTGTENLDEVLREADVIVAAVGVPHVLRLTRSRTAQSCWTLVFPALRTRRPARRSYSATVSPEAAQKASWFPNPAVWPMTRAELLVNVVETAERQAA